MWPGNRQLALSLLFFTLSTLAVSAAKLDSKHVPNQTNIRIVSISADKSGNFVLLKTSKGGQLPPPVIRVFPTEGGEAVMTVDFSSTVDLVPPARIPMADSLVSSLHIGQFALTPPITRISFVAGNTQVFKRVQFRSSAGQLSINLPKAEAPKAEAPKAEAPRAEAHRLEAPKAQTPGVQAPRTEAAKTDPRSAPRISPAYTRAIPDLAPDAVSVPSKAAKSWSSDAVSNDLASSSRPQLRGPILLENQAAMAPPPAPSFAPPSAAKRVPAGKHGIKLADATYERIPEQVIVPAPDRSSSRNKKVSVDANPPRDSEQPKESAVLRVKDGVKASFGGRDFTSVIEEENNPTYRPLVATLAAPSTAGGIKVSVSGCDPITVQVSSPTPLSFNAFRLHDPERLVIDVEADYKSNVLNIPDIPTNPWIKGIRVGNPDGAPSTNRIVLDLVKDEPALVEDANSRRTSLSFTLQSVAPEIATPAVPKRIAGCRVVLDAGHGGTDPGAQRGDVQEKEITLQIVDKLKRDLEARGVKVSLTRADDTYVSLEDRVRITNGLQPDAFVSVHINSLETNNGTHGIETYFQTDKSKNLAQLIHGSLVKELGAPDRSIRKARFYVINHTPVPAILAEVGFISNKDERDKLISSDYQRQIASALTDGVMLYLAENKPSTAVMGPESGTISAMVPSPRAQSFTQNLHWRTPPQGGHRKPQTCTGRTIRATRKTERAPTKLAHQQLKFKKHRLASLRS